MSLQSLLFCQWLHPRMDPNAVDLRDWALSCPATCEGGPDDLERLDSRLRGNDVHGASH